jgi:hypothetical protein
MLTSRERLEATLDHRQPDRLCVDIGGATGSGVAASVVWALRRRLLGSDEPVRVSSPYWMQGDIDEPLRHALGGDVANIRGTGYSFRTGDERWTPHVLFDGTPVLFPADIAVTTDENGDWLIHPLGDRSLPPSHRMPKGGFYFDSIIRQGPIDEDALDPADNCEEFVLLKDEQVDHVARAAMRLAAETQYGIMIELPGASLGGIGGLPGRDLREPKGIRSPEEWYISYAIRKDYVKAVFARQTEIALENIRRLAKAVGDAAQVALVCGTDFGTQRGPLISKDTYVELFSPFYRRLNDAVHSLTPWKTYKHSCGDNYELLGLMIDDGFDIFNPVQTSAGAMDPVRLKREFGDDLVFWGGGVDTQRTLPFGTPEQVYREARQRIDIFNDRGGFVFSAVHTIQDGTPVDNVLAMLRAVRDSDRAL